MNTFQNLYIDFKLASNLLNVNNITGNSYTAISSVLASLIIVILFIKKVQASKHWRQNYLCSLPIHII